MADAGDRPPQSFLDELGAAFRRLRPQGSLRWNFADGLNRLGRVVTGRVDLGDGHAPPVAGKARRRHDRAVAEALAQVQEALDGAHEALRYLGARVSALEDSAARRRDPLDPQDAVASLVGAPDLSGFAEEATRWFAGVPGPVVIAECGDGALVAALASTGLTVRGAEPRAANVLVAARRGLDVQLGSATDLLSTVEPGGLGGVLLAGVVDRIPVEDAVDLLRQARARVAPGGVVAVVSDARGAGPSAGPVAGDLLPGRPLQPATWELLLRRGGCTEVRTVRGADAARAAVVGRVRADGGGNGPGGPAQPAVTDSAQTDPVSQP